MRKCYNFLMIGQNTHPGTWNSQQITTVLGNIDHQCRVVYHTVNYIAKVHFIVNSTVKPHHILYSTAKYHYILNSLAKLQYILTIYRAKVHIIMNFTLNIHYLLLYYIKNRIDLIQMYKS